MCRSDNAGGSEFLNHLLRGDEVIIGGETGYILDVSGVGLRWRRWGSGGNNAFGGSGRQGRGGGPKPF